MFQRARKIFDPADHDLPARVIKKCRVSSPPPFIEEKVKEEKEKPSVPAPSPKKKSTTQSKSKSKPDPESDPEPDACLYCDLGDMKNEKLVSCKDCQTIGKISPDLASLVLKVLSIQCIPAV